MRIVQDGDTLNVSEIEELASANSMAFQSAIGAALPLTVKQINIDLSRAGFVDCGGLGALIALRKRARQCNAQVTIRLCHPTGPARRLVRLTGLEELFPIEPEH
jgi:anti-anti-sigma factor